MLNKFIQWFNRNSCKECDYCCVKNNVCQSKKCETCGCHQYVNWFDRHFCKAHKEESDDKNTNNNQEVITILTELQQEIEENVLADDSDTLVPFIQARETCVAVIQQKINELKGNTNGNNS